MTDNETPMFSIDESEADRIEMGAAHITNEVVGLLNTALAASGLTRRELAARLGIGESRVSQVLNGDGNLRLTTLGRFLAAMNCKVDMAPRGFDAPSPRRRSRSQRPPEPAVSVWEHSVTSKAGCYSAYVVAQGILGASDVIHQTGGLVFDSTSLPARSWQTWESLGHIETGTFKTKWVGTTSDTEQEATLSREVMPSA